MAVNTPNAAVGSGHGKPVDALFASWSPALLRYAFRLCRIPEMAEDLVQEAFLALCRKSVRGEDVCDPRRWTLAVVRQQVAKHFRDRKRHGEELQPGEFLDQLAAAAIPSQADSEAWPDVYGLLDVLTPREKQVVLLRLESLKYLEIARQLGISPKTVAALLARALEKLQLAAERPLYQKQLATTTVRTGRSSARLVRSTT